MRVRIFNLNDEFADIEREKGNCYRFASLAELKEEGLEVDSKNYDCVLDADWKKLDGLSNKEALHLIYEMFNVGQRPIDFSRHSLSVSDVVELNGKDVYYVDSYCFEPLPNFFSEPIEEVRRCNLFELGDTYCTDTICKIARENPIFDKELAACFRRHLTGDFGEEMCKEDIDSNTAAIWKEEGRVLSTYMTSRGMIFIITDIGTSTCVMFPDEY